jgi:putative peptidoglycan lipid II flippase
MTIKNFFSSIQKNSTSFFIKRQNTIVSAAFIIMAVTAISKILGLFKLTLLANIFGLSRSLDIFYAADSIPQIFFNILVLGSFNTALIPVIGELVFKKKSETMWKVFNSFLNIFALILLVVGILGIIFAREVAVLFIYLATVYRSSAIPNFRPSDITLISSLMQILFISPIILGISFIFSSLLQVYKRFLVTQVATVLYNLGFIIGILFFTPFLGIYGLCWGIVLGSVLHLLVQFPVAKYLGFSYKSAILGFKNKYIKELFVLSLPRFIGIAFSQLAYFVESFIAFALVPGSLTAFNWATSLYLFPVAVIGWSFAQASFPTLAEESSANMLETFKKTVSKTVNQTLFFVIPIFVVILILRLPIVRLILGPGSNSKFGWNDTILTSWILLFLSLSIIGQAILSILIRAFYSLKDTKTPVIVEILTFILNIILALYFVRVFGNFPVISPTIGNIFNVNNYIHFSSKFTWKAIGGLGFASGIAVTLNVLVLIYLLGKRLKGFSFKEFYLPAIKKLSSGAFMSVVMYFVYKLLSTIFNTSKTVDVIFLFLITIYIGLSAYFIAAFVLNDSDLDLLTRGVYAFRNILYGKKLKGISGVDDSISNSPES